MATLGFGDIKPYTTHEIVMVIICLTAGACHKFLFLCLFYIFLNYVSIEIRFYRLEISTNQLMNLHLINTASPGACSFAWVIGQITPLLASFNVRYGEYRDKVARIRSEMMVASVSSKVSKRIALSMEFQ
jgi:hypothetical protein